MVALLFFTALASEEKLTRLKETPGHRVCAQNCGSRLWSGAAAAWVVLGGSVLGPTVSFTEDASQPALQNLQGKEQLRADGSDRHVVSVTTHLYRVTAVSPRDQSLGPQPAVARGGLLRECHAIGEVTPFVSRQHSIGLLWCSVFGEPMMLLSFPEF